MELFRKVNFTSMKLNEISIVRTIRKCIGTRYDMSYGKVTTIQKIRNKTLRENVILIFSIFFFNNAEGKNIQTMQRNFSSTYLAWWSDILALKTYDSLNYNNLRGSTFATSVT